MRYLRRLNYSPETISAYTKDLKRFKAYLVAEYGGNILTSQIQREDILDYLQMLQDEGLKPNSLARNLSTLKSFFKFLVHELNFPNDVATRIKHAKFHTPLPIILDEEEMERLLDIAKTYSPFYFALFSLLYYTGSRLTPVRTIMREHIDLRNRKIYFEKVKNGRDLYLPLGDDIFDILNQFMLDTKHLQYKYLFNSPKLMNNPISAADVRVNLKKICALADINKRVTPHTIRHCTATHLTLKGVGQKYISEILGHTDLRSTARYQQLNVEDLRASINELSFHNGEQ